MKKLEVIPILKEGDYEIPNDNRPVFLISVASKICGRVVLNQLMEYMYKKGCLPEHQSGNKKLHSIETLNILVSDVILDAMDRINSLLANPEKTKLLLFGTPQMPNHVQNFRVTFLDKELQPVSSARNLGVEFDGCLSYDEHTTQVVSKCTKSLCLINRDKHILDSRTLIVIINALVFSKLYYCSSVWANTSKKNIAKLELHEL